MAFEDGPELNIDELLPERCRGCKYAEFMFTLLIAFSSSTGGPETQERMLEDIEERCPGLPEPVIDSERPKAISIIEDPFEPGSFIGEAASDDIKPNAIFMTRTDQRDNCPYRYLEH